MYKLCTVLNCKIYIGMIIFSIEQTMLGFEGKWNMREENKWEGIKLEKSKKIVKFINDDVCLLCYLLFLRVCKECSLSYLIVAV
jgi:hypothetical protein